MLTPSQYGIFHRALFHAWVEADVKLEMNQCPAMRPLLESDLARVKEALALLEALPCDWTKTLTREVSVR